MSVLVLADHDLGRLSPSTARTVHAVAELGPIDILVLGEGVDQVVADAAQISGVQRVRVSQDSGFVGQSAEALVPLLAELAEGYSHIVASAGSVGRDVMPRLAAKLDLMPVTDVTALLGPNRFERPIYAGNAIETVTSNQTQHVLTIRTSSFAPAANGNSATIEPVSHAPVISAARLIDALRTEGDTPDLGSARIVVGGGVSVGSAEGFKLIEQLAAQLGAAVGATRAAVDAGYAPNDWQVGQTGKVIAPDLYIAVGISGALQHLAGIQGAKKIIAINKDAEAPLVQIAELRLIGDLFEMVPALMRELEARGVRQA
ncbi:electron transfer flavoprotein subunit beta [Devosia pacifica]|uniref:Electron transfer flavoprotein subunit alpha n=1 Tax=Devosia pacifica TaxID=1335967 RepID=A0A918S619_9HYPH|nr:FAD-binding protein [Devosia pacifica]GHA26432.1 electron transfer flavoprotein subunit beta [Devosia pacifica]